MKLSNLIILFSAVLISCQDNATKHSKETVQSSTPQPMNNLTILSSSDLNGFEWLNQPMSFSVSDGILRIQPGDSTDYFNDPSSGEIKVTAPMLFKEVEGDFVATALVKPNLKDVWNACVLMVYQDSTDWAKLCFENSDATGPSVVSVVTRGSSDDANGVKIDQEMIWLKIARKGNVFAMYWSVDGNDYKMARLFALPKSDKVKIGMVAQCPASKSVEHEFHYFSLENKTVKNLRTGI